MNRYSRTPYSCLCQSQGARICRRLLRSARFFPSTSQIGQSAAMNGRSGQDQREWRGNLQAARAFEACFLRCPNRFPAASWSEPSFTNSANRERPLWATPIISFVSSSACCSCRQTAFNYLTNTCLLLKLLRPSVGHATALVKEHLSSVANWRSSGSQDYKIS